MIELADHDPGWAGAFEAERARVLSALGERTLIEHIGSTAVPGLPAQPIIDIAVGGDFRWVPSLTALGYVRVPEGDVDGRLFLRRLDADGVVRFHLSLASPRGAFWTDQIGFRDALRRDGELARRYGALKRQLALELDDPVAYTRAKSDLVREALLAADHRARGGSAAER